MEYYDSISRQDAINKIKPWLEVKGYGWGELNMLRAVINELENMSSAQPDIIHCKDCKHYSKHKEDYMCGLNVLAYVREVDFCSRAERREDGRPDL